MREPAEYACDGTVAACGGRAALDAIRKRHGMHLGDIVCVCNMPYQLRPWGWLYLVEMSGMHKDDGR